MRTKRDDTRPNEKQRRKLMRKIEDDKVITDIRVTKKRRCDYKERVPPETMAPAKSDSEKV
jgi:hypothetical protein